MKQYAKRWLASILAVMMVIAVMPNYAFAVDDNDTSAGSTPTCVCETKCTDTQVNENCPVCGAEGADLSTCKGTEIIPALECNCTTRCAEGTVKADCPVCGAEGADLSACKGTDTIPEPECTCETKCTEGSVNQNCAVCSVENADLTQCTGKEAVPELVCTCETQCTEDTQNDRCEKCAADWTQCQGLALTAPNPLSGDDIPTEYAMCSYVNTEGSKSDTNVTLPEAVKILNENGGGRITVISSGLVGEKKSSNYSLDVMSDITIVAEPDNPVTVTVEGILFELWNKERPSTGKSYYGKLTLGQEGMSDGLLTFTGAREASCFIGSNQRSAIAGAKVERIRQVEINDGVVLEGFVSSVVGYYMHDALDVTMNGGEIKNNGPIEDNPDNSSFIIRCMQFKMYGGTIHDNVANGHIIMNDPYSLDLPEDELSDTIITGDSKLYNNKGLTTSFAGSIIHCGNDVVMSGNAEIYDCTGTVSGVIYGETVTLKDYASIHDCISTGEEGSAGIWADNIIFTDDASIYDCEFTEGSVLQNILNAGGSVTMSGNASIRNCTVLSVNSNYWGYGGAVTADQDFIMKDTAIISNCKSPDRAGAVSVQDGDAKLSGNATIENCSALKADENNVSGRVRDDIAGGLYVETGNLIMSGDSKITGCYTDAGYAGGAYVKTGYVTLSDQASIVNCTNETTINAEQYENNYYAGGLLSGGGNIEIGENAKITRCSGPVGGISCTSKVSSLTNNTKIEVNIAGEISENSGAIGGGICALKGVLLTLSETAVIKNNTATVAGGGVAFFNYADKLGSQPSSVLTINNATITKNIAPLGGGIFVAGTADVPQTPVFYSDHYADNSGPCTVILTGGTITGNTAGNPKGGAATEFLGGGMFLGWDTNTTISGVICISDNKDENGSANNVYLRKDPDFEVQIPNTDQSELEALSQYLSDANAKYLEEELMPQFESQLERYEYEELKSELQAYGLVANGSDLPLAELKSIYLDLLRDYYAVPNMDNLEDFIAQYKKSEPSFVPSYEGFRDIYLGFITNEYHMANGRVIFVQISDDQEDLNAYALMLGLIGEGGNYTGTATEFANAFVAYANAHSELFVPDHDTYQKLWFGNDGDSAAAVFDARLSVSGTLAGSQIGIITEGATYGRVVAVGSSQYPITDDDLSVFSSDDPAFRIVRHPTKDNQLILESRYTIRAIAGANGSISPEGDVVVISGQNQTFTITPASGYHISDVKVDGVSQGAITSYTFEDVRANHTIEVIFAKSDLGGDSGGANHPEYTPDDDDDRDDEDDTEEVIDEEVPLAETPWLNTEDHYAYIVGYSEDGTVRPNANITRAEVATIFFRLLTDEARDQFWSTSNNFTDVAADAWYNNAISTMVNAGIIQGYEDGTFRPNANITRAEFAAIASRFMSAGYDVEEDLFTDIAAHWARESINDAAMAKWISGYPDGAFLPDKAITRAEAVTLVNNVLQRKPDADHMLDSMIKWSDNMDTSAWYYEAIQEATNSHDYDLFEGAEYETWTALQENRDWAALEKDWVNAHRTGGEVM